MIAEFPHYPAVHSYDALRQKFIKASNRDLRRFTWSTPRPTTESPGSDALDVGPVAGRVRLRAADGDDDIAGVVVLDTGVSRNVDPETDAAEDAGRRAGNVGAQPGVRRPQCRLRAAPQARDRQVMACCTRSWAS